MPVVVMVARPKFAQGVFAYRRQRQGAAPNALRDLIVWCTCCRAELAVDANFADDKTYVGTMWQRVHNHSVLGAGYCPFRDVFVVELPQ